MTYSRLHTLTFITIVHAYGHIAVLTCPARVAGAVVGHSAHSINAAGTVGYRAVTTRIARVALAHEGCTGAASVSMNVALRMAVEVGASKPRETVHAIALSGNGAASLR